MRNSTTICFICAAQARDRVSGFYTCDACANYLSDEDRRLMASGIVQSVAVSVAIKRMAEAESRAKETHRRAEWWKGTALSFKRSGNGAERRLAKANKQSDILRGVIILALDHMNRGETAQAKELLESVDLQKADFIAQNEEASDQEAWSAIRAELFAETSPGAWTNSMFTLMQMLEASSPYLSGQTSNVTNAIRRTMLIAGDAFCYPTGEVLDRKAWVCAVVLGLLDEDLKGLHNMGKKRVEMLKNMVSIFLGVPQGEPAKTYIDAAKAIL